jgi:hypothetical protein
MDSRIRIWRFAMARYLPRLGLVLSFGALTALAVVFAYSAQADSTISIPVPEGTDKARGFTISLKIPPKTDPLTQTDAKPKLKSRSSLIVWDANPSPKIDNNDEFLVIADKFRRKGWVKTLSAQAIVRMRPMDRYYAVRLIQSIVNSVMEVALAPNITRVIRKCNLEASDIEDLRRMINRFNVDLIRFGMNTKNVDKDLLMLQERFKVARQGILKVIKVEGVDDGGTVIHLGVD